MNKIFLLLILTGTFFAVLPITAQNTAKNRIAITAGNTVITAELDDSQTTRDFIATLPRTIAMKRWDNREFYGNMGKRLSENGEKIPDFTNGDVTWYVPGNSFAIFYANDDKSNLANLVRMGKITSDLRAFEKLPDSIDMKIEIIKGNL